MKILLIEDMLSSREKIMEAIEGLGEIIECVGDDLRMLPFAEIICLIQNADLIFLDNSLSTNYTGEDLLPYCEGKKVISISSTLNLPSYFPKTHLGWGERGEKAAEELRTLVKSMIEK